MKMSRVTAVDREQIHQVHRQVAYTYVKIEMPRSCSHGRSSEIVRYKLRGSAGRRRNGRSLRLEYSAASFKVKNGE